LVANQKKQLPQEESSSSFDSSSSDGDEESSAQKKKQSEKDKLKRILALKNELLRRKKTQAMHGKAPMTKEDEVQFLKERSERIVQD